MSGPQSRLLLRDLKWGWQEQAPPAHSHPSPRRCWGRAPGRSTAGCREPELGARVHGGKRPGESSPHGRGRHPQVPEGHGTTWELRRRHCHGGGPGFGAHSAACRPQVSALRPGDPASRSGQSRVDLAEAGVAGRGAESPGRPRGGAGPAVLSGWAPPLAGWTKRT